MNVIDKLIKRTIKTKNPTVIGLDPDIGKIPACYKRADGANPLSATADVIYDFNCDIIDVIADLVPAVTHMQKTIYATLKENFPDMVY